MGDTFGATFAPFPDPSGQNKSVSPIQQAVQLLSLRVPRVVGAAAPASAALLNSPGSSGSPDVHSAVLQTILKTIMGSGTPMSSAAPPLSPMGPVPAAMSPTGPSVPATPFAAPRDAAPAPPLPPGAPHLSFEEGPGLGGAPHPDPAPEPATVAPPVAEPEPSAAPSMPLPPDQRDAPDPMDRRRNRM